MAIKIVKAKERMPILRLSKIKRKDKIVDVIVCREGKLS